MAKKEIKDKKTTSKRKSKKEEVENEIKPEGNKIYLYKTRFVFKIHSMTVRYRTNNRLIFTYDINMIVFTKQIYDNG